MRTDLQQPKECFCAIVINYEKEDVAERENTDDGSSESAGSTSCSASLVARRVREAETRGSAL